MKRQYISVCIKLPSTKAANLAKIGFFFINSEKGNYLSNIQWHKKQNLNQK